MENMSVLLMVMLTLWWCPTEGFTNHRKSLRTCQSVTIPMCKSVGYNLTYMPNQFNHENQEEAGLEVHQFWPLVEIKCSPYLRFFLCSMYAPICLTNYEKPLPVCRHVCQKAKKGCAPLMRQYGFPWPEKMNCDQLPKKGDPQNLCMHNEVMDARIEKMEREGTLPAIDPTLLKKFRPKGKIPDRPTPKQPLSKMTKKPKDKLPKEPQVVERDNLCVESCCNKRHFVSVAEGKFHDKIVTGGVKNCALKCQESYFSEDDQRFATFWVGLWSVLCALSTLITVLTFLIDTERFKYPERPIVFLSACYFMVSVGYIIRLAAGPRMSCDGDMIRYQSTGPALCSTVFFLIYYFGMSSSIWWVILTFTWFLAAGAKWAAESIQRFSQYFHTIAWVVPIIKTIIVFATSSVDGDPVAGICYVGNQNMNNLLGFVLVPLCVYLLFGTSFLLAGFVSMCRIRNEIKQQGLQRTKKLERLMIRIGVFGLLYTVPATIVIACYFYERHMKPRWEVHKNCADELCGPDVPMDFSVFMLKYFMCLIVGLVSGFWIWSGKTVDSWRRFWARLCGGSHISKRPVGSKYSVYQPTLIKPPTSPLSHV